jgi:hypothetical protein
MTRISLTSSGSTSYSVVYDTGSNAAKAFGEIFDKLSKTVSIRKKRGEKR